ncbi:hypothetical protein CDL15_Pgr013079 [Punica granatum]|uniref:Uncharacterized protein n=1 Tax=Punica granatum TaxID=22663 RepID=A0A218WK46_PUNGR|nr:hypothetical protein CDL15_Pgr013079 [Punica granatum]
MASLSKMASQEMNEARGKWPWNHRSLCHGTFIFLGRRSCHSLKVLNFQVKAFHSIVSAFALIVEDLA